MAHIPEALQNQLNLGVTTLAWVWILTRRDQSRFGFTDHDRSLTVEGVICDPQSGFEGGSLRTQAGEEAARGVVFGQLNSPVITDADLRAGLWDGAQLIQYRVNWKSPDLKFQTFTGELGAMRSGPEGFEAEVQGLSARLNRTLGRVFSRRCDAQLGDERCGVNMASRRQTLTVSTQISARVWQLEGELSDPSAYVQGRWRWPDRTLDQAFRMLTVQALAGGIRVELDQAVPGSARSGEHVTLEQGCDKRFETCRKRFSNALNFRGCPHMPGNDALLRVAREGGARPRPR